MEEVLQYGTLGILAVVVIFGLLFLIKWLTGFIECQKKVIAGMTEDFKNTMDNHLDCQAEVMKELTRAIENLCRSMEKRQ